VEVVGAAHAALCHFDDPLVAASVSAENAFRDELAAGQLGLVGDKKEVKGLDFMYLYGREAEWTGSRYLWTYCAD
jgi:hypothetical protein